MISEKLKLLSDLHTPLFDATLTHNVGNPKKFIMGDGFSVFHIGNGYFLGCAHPLYSETKYLQSIQEDLFDKLILSQLDTKMISKLKVWYYFDKKECKWFIRPLPAKELNDLINIFYEIKFDTRWINHLKLKLGEMSLLIRRDKKLADHFPLAENYRHKKGNTKDLIVLPLELVGEYQHNDVTLFRMEKKYEHIYQKLPFLSLSYELYDTNSMPTYLLHNGPARAQYGRTINKMSIEGHIEHYSHHYNGLHPMYKLKGLRYLTKGYFIFGSSGGPFLIYDEKLKKFKANGIQSEASPSPLEINNVRDDNYHFNYGIISPLHNIKKLLERDINKNG